MFYVGVDIGGTNIAAGVVDSEKGILNKGECPTLADRPYEELLQSIFNLCKNVIDESDVDYKDISAIGIGMPGIETPEGLAHCKNLFWHGVTLRSDLEKLMGKKVHIDNDAHAAALGEMGFGNLKGTKDAIMLTLGTGLGGAIIVDGRVISGHNHAGGELGHVTFVHGGVQCACGRKGCLEKYTAATALIRIGKEYAQKHKDSLLHSAVGGLEHISAKDVVDGAREKDQACILAFEDYCEYLSDGIISFINMLNPQRICIGGGLANAGDFLFDNIREKCSKKYFSPLHNDTEIVPALLKNDAGILGAAMVAKQGES